MKWNTGTLVLLAGLCMLGSCSKDKNNGNNMQAHDPDKAEAVAVDRFSSTAGHLQVRTSTNGLPQPNEAVNFDHGPFVTEGLAPNGKKIEYYNFDVQSLKPAPIYVLVKNGQQVAGQLNIVNVVPGESDYNDFWQIHKVTVPNDYVANSVTSYDEIVANNYPVEKTNDLVNCPVVPRGSTATKRIGGNDPGLSRGWYKGKVVYYFNFSEGALTANANGEVPVSTIYVSFNTNPGQPNGGPASGFKTETGNMQTHNVTASVPADAGYSPLWIVVAYDNNSFNSVMDLTSVSMAPVLVPNAGSVNCPIVFETP